VCAGVWMLRIKRPELPRAFRVAAIPVVATLGIVVCGSMIYGLGLLNWIRLAVWLAIGLVFYFAYGRTHSKIHATGSLR
jgi:APA family basic amino acid/polyamine antiporter